MFSLLNVNSSIEINDFHLAWFPHGLQNLEKMRKLFPVREKSGNFEQTGKVREFHSSTGKMREFYTKFEPVFILFFSVTIYLKCIC